MKHIRIFELTVPSFVTAANTVEEYGDQETSATTALRSKMNIGVLTKTWTYFKVRGYLSHYTEHKVILKSVLN